MSKYIVEKGKAISTKAGIVSENQEVSEELLNGNAKELIKAGIIREIKEEKKNEDDKEEKKNEDDKEEKKNKDDKKRNV